MSMQTTLRMLLQEKGGRVHTIEPDRRVAEAVRRMVEARIGALLVMTEGRVCGIFTERDVLGRVVAEGRDPEQTPVEDVMTNELIYVTPSTTVEDAMLIVTEKRCRHLPVMEAGELLGLVSSGDLTRWLVRDQEATINHLVGYISGSTR